MQINTEESINHRRYLHSQESQVPKLLIEAANLLLVQPGPVLHGRLKKKQRFTLIYVRSFTFLDGINHLLTQRPYFQAEIFHKPLVPQEVARHVGVAVIDQRSEAHREQLQIRILHGPVQSSVANAHVLTANKPQPSTPFNTCAASCKVTIVRLFMGSFSLRYKPADTFI